MKQKILCFLLALCLLAVQMPVKAVDSAPFTLLRFSTNHAHTVSSVDRFPNWAGVSTVSQFTDEHGNYCFAVNEGDRVLVFKTKYGQITDRVSISNPYDSFGAATCDKDGNLYMVWGNNGNSNVNEQTILVSKYTSDGQLVTTVGGNGSEGMKKYYTSDFYTKIPFDGGNCDVAINGDLLLVNYARLMYGGHQANTVFPVKLSTMQVQSGIDTYNSHSFDQRITPYSKTGGFLLASHGDCFPRAFTTSVTNSYYTRNEMDTFNFWVEEGAYENYHMGQLNKTYARLGNILETPRGAALVGSSARSLSESAKSEPYDVFVQVFNPEGSATSASSYVTTGTRSGLAGANGNKSTTDYGVQWITDLSSVGKTADVVQAVSVSGGRIAVLYELYVPYSSYNGYLTYDSTWYALLDSDGTVLQQPVNLGNVRLNVDEDPVYAGGAIQWTANHGSNLAVYALFPDLSESRDALETWRDTMFFISDSSLSLTDGFATAQAVIHTDSIIDTTVYCGFYDAAGKQLEVQSARVSGLTEKQLRFTTQKSDVAEARLFLLDGVLPICEKYCIKP